jgi:tetratricopeptide (TPR) repeat protein
MGREKIKLQLFESALKEFDKVIELDPNYKDVYINSAFVKMCTGDLEGAGSDFSKVDPTAMSMGMPDINMIPDRNNPEYFKNAERIIVKNLENASYEIQKSITEAATKAENVDINDFRTGLN